MGEAWFMGLERRKFPELNDRDSFYQIEPYELTMILFEITSGTKCFGHMREWDEWFKYLLPDLILRSREVVYFDRMLVQNVISAFMNIYWREITEEYAGFRKDVIDSLSHCLMDAGLWPEKADERKSSLRPVFLDFFEDGAGNPRLSWHCGQSDGNLSAMMFFCIKYLRPDEIVTWVASIVSIPDIYWRGALMVWLLGAFDLLHEPVVVPSQIERTDPKIDWDNSHGLGSSYGSIDAKYPPDEDFNDNKDFLKPENTKIFLREIRRLLTEELIVDWAASFGGDRQASESTYNVPELLLDKLAERSI